MEKKKFAIFFVITAICLFTTNQLLTYSTGAPARYTGAPSEKNCGACHTTNADNSGDGGLTVQVLEYGTPVTFYESGKTYSIRLNLEAHSEQQSNLVGGFEVTAINSAGLSVGNWSIDTYTMKIVQGVVNGKMRRYVTHTSPTAFHKNNGISWEMDWTAPADDTGPVSFYVAGNSANNNMNNQGDFIYTASLTLPFSSIAGIENLPNSVTSIKILQNPVKDFLNFEVSTTRPDMVGFSLTGISGQVITLSTNREIMAGKNNFSYSTAGLSPGIYLLKMQGKNLQLSQKVVVSS